VTLNLNEYDKIFGALEICSVLAMIVVWIIRCRHQILFSSIVDKEVRTYKILSHAY
jgi:hypothetical protein